MITTESSVTHVGTNGFEPVKSVPPCIEGVREEFWSGKSLLSGDKIQPEKMPVKAWAATEEREFTYSRSETHMPELYPLTSKAK